MDDGSFPEGGAASGFAQTLLREIAEHLSKLADTGQPNAIDLSALPMGKRDRDMLEELLGHGEVEAALDVAGETVVWETQYCGVWWIRHMGAGDRIASERIEIAEIPEILVGHRADIAAAARRMIDDIAERKDFTMQEDRTHVGA